MSPLTKATGFLVVVIVALLISETNASEWLADVRAAAKEGEDYWHQFMMQEIANSLPFEENTPKPTLAIVRPPSFSPSGAPTIVLTKGPTSFPTIATTTPTATATVYPTGFPSPLPTKLPSMRPSDLSDQPSLLPSDTPSLVPSEGPSKITFDSPSLAPSDGPSMIPSDLPSLTPSDGPSMIPSDLPSLAPSDGHSMIPSDSPSLAPSVEPSMIPSDSPSLAPSVGPSMIPSDSPSLAPSVGPSMIPSDSPSLAPSVGPSMIPSDSPSLAPSVGPSMIPSDSPSLAPSVGPSMIPSDLPSLVPSTAPTNSPSMMPSFQCGVNTSLECFSESGTSCANLEPISQICSVGSQIEVVSFRVLGSNCKESKNSQGEEFFCEDFNETPLVGTFVDISCDDDDQNIFLNETVAIGDRINIQDPSGDALSTAVTCSIREASSGVELQTVSLDTSGTVDLFLKDTYGMLELEACGLESTVQDCIVPIVYTYNVENIGATEIDITLIERFRGGETVDLLEEISQSNPLQPLDGVTRVEMEEIDACVDGLYVTTVVAEAVTTNGKTCQAEGVFEFETFDIFVGTATPTTEPSTTPTSIPLVDPIISPPSLEPTAAPSPESTDTCDLTLEISCIPPEGSTNCDEIPPFDCELESCFQTITLVFSIGVPVGIGSIVELTSLTAVTNIDEENRGGVIDLSGQVGGALVIPTGSLEIQEEFQLDLTQRQQYTTFGTIVGRTNDGSGCFGTGAYQFTAGNPPSFPTISPSMGPSLSLFPTPNPETSVCNLDATITCALVDGGNCENLTPPTSRTCTGGEAELLQFIYLPSSLCNISSAPGLLTCNDVNLDIIRPSRVYASLSSGDEVYFMGAVKANEVFSVPLGGGSDVDISISTLVSDEPGELLQRSQLSPRCDSVEESITLLDSYGHLQLVGYRNAELGSQQAIIELQIDYTASNLGRAGADLTGAFRDSPFAGFDALLRNGDPIALENFQDSVSFPETIQLDLISAEESTFYDFTFLINGIGTVSGIGCQDTAQFTLTVN